jgi:hypothetical protein
MDYQVVWIREWGIENFAALQLENIKAMPAAIVVGEQPPVEGSTWDS